jgi:hypothetical protein
VKVPEALKGIDWRGRILIDATNAHMDAKPDISLAGVTRSRAALKGRRSSEIVAEMAVGARVVKSISNMPMAWIQDFSPNKPRTVIFTSGDDAEAKKLVIELINSTRLVAIDLGSLAKGDAMHGWCCPPSSRCEVVSMGQRHEANIGVIASGQLIEWRILRHQYGHTTPSLCRCGVSLG